MNAVILAAGRGTRIRSVHGEHPKCLMKMNDSTILEHQIDNLLNGGISKIGIVVGYEKDQTIDHVRNRYRDCPRRFHFIVNPRFAETRNIYSLWLASEWLNGGNDSFVCLNANMVFDVRALLHATRLKTSITMVVDPEWRDEAMKVVTRYGLITRMSKSIPQAEFSGSYIGITVFPDRIRARFLERVDALIQSRQVNDFFTLAVQQFVDEGVTVGCASSANLPWAEIDDPAGLAFAQQNIFPQLAEVSVEAAMAA
jgi:L-glutamine-phosphate cytidylyltransferase